MRLLRSAIFALLLIPACQPEDAREVGPRELLPRDHPMVVAVNNCLVACNRLANEESTCQGSPTLLDCGHGCKFAARIDRCVPEFIEWANCRADNAHELECSSAKREPVFAGCEATEENFQRCVGKVL